MFELRFSNGGQRGPYKTQQAAIKAAYWVFENSPTTYHSPIEIHRIISQGNMRHKTRKEKHSGRIYEHEEYMTKVLRIISGGNS